MAGRIAQNLGLLGDAQIEQMLAAHVGSSSFEQMLAAHDPQIAPADNGALADEDQAILDSICGVITERPHLAFPLVEWMIPAYTFAPSKAVTGPGSKRFQGKFSNITPQGYSFITCPEAKELFGFDVFCHAAQRGHFNLNDDVNFAVLLNKDGKPQAFDLTPGSTHGFVGSNSDTALGKGKQAFGQKGGKGWISWGQKGKPGEQQGGSSFDQKGGKSGQKGGGTTTILDIGEGARKNGHISAFYPEKNFGFVKCDETFPLYGKDLWVHGEQISTFSVGDSVSFTLVLNKEGKPQAVDLQPPFSRPASHVVSLYPRLSVPELGVPKSDASSLLQKRKEPVAAAETAGQRFVGIFSAFYPVKNFGFIQCAETFETYAKDIWVHSAQTAGHSVGDTVEFTLTMSKVGNPQAIDLTSVGDPASQLFSELHGPASKLARLIE